jgi:tetratricopeptide (TPR) repeat protein
MDTYTDSQIKASQFTSSKPIYEDSEESIKKIAVLFTDIVGSSKFFKSHGDKAGRKMLRQHQEMASPAVVEHGGIVVKILGDSIMAYFSNPQEALKSAVKIQQKFQSFNQAKDPRYQIHIRMCIHYGGGIVEDNDIFGDVVNMAAKFLPLAGSGQIFVSHELYTQAQGLPSLHFEAVDLSSNKDVLKGLTIYKLIWDETVTFDPYVKTLLYFKPVWELCESHFAKAWDSLIDNKDSLWTGKVEKENILADKSMALIVKDPRSSLSLAMDVMQFLNSKLEKDNLPFLPLQIIVDSGTYVRADRLILEDLKVEWEEIKPGNIYISFAAYKAIGESEALSVYPKPDQKHPRSFYKVDLNDQLQNEPGLFLYQSVLAQGKYSPCYYCGDRKHLTASCPSKQFSKITHVMKDLGYLPLEEINKLFFNYITKTNVNTGDGVESLGKSGRAIQWAYNGFCELKMVYQLRFLRLLWRTKEESWNNIKENKNETAKGGLIWLGQDCLRVSKLDQAETILLNALAKHPQDYRVHCAMGFVNVEDKEFLQAKHYFSKALEYAETKPQKIFAHFLLSRLYCLNNNLGKAEDHINKILNIEPGCSEAVYQDIIFQFSRQRVAEALRRLIKLIGNNREYYVYALIDPELAAFNEIIHLELNNLLNEAREEAKQIRAEAEQKAIKLEKQLTAEEKKVNNSRALFSKIEELAKADSYFNCLDIIYYGSSIIDIGSRYLENRRMKLLRVLNKLRPRVKSCIVAANNFSNRHLIAAISRKLKHIQIKMDDNETIARGSDPERLSAAFVQANKLAKEMKQVESELKKLRKTEQMLFFINKFIKKLFIFQSVNLLITLLLFPICTYYLHFFLPEIRITPENIWEYQKIVMILGGFSGLCMALMLSTKNLPEE